MTLEKLKEHCKKQMGMYGGNVSTNVYLEHSMVLGLINEHENKAKHDSELLDKVKTEIKNWQYDIHDNEYDADKFDFVFERIFDIIAEMKAEVEE